MIRRSGIAELVAGSDEQDIKVVNTNLFVTSKKRNHQLTNLKCCKMSFKAFKMKKQG